jgi:hypothetical protein
MHGRDIGFRYTEHRRRRATAQNADLDIGENVLLDSWSRGWISEQTWGGLRKIIEWAAVTALHELAFNGFIIIRNKDGLNESGEIGSWIASRV